MKKFLQEHINDLNAAVKIFKTKYKREPLDLDELFDFLTTLNFSILLSLFDK